MPKINHKGSGEISSVTVNGKQVWTRIKYKESLTVDETGLTADGKQWVRWGPKDNWVIGEHVVTNGTVKSTF